MIQKSSQILLPVTTQQEIQKICQCMIGNFVEQIDLSSISFPFIKSTYTLWRKIAYKVVSQRFGNVKGYYKKFSTFSQGLYLPIFVERLQENIKMIGDGFKKILHQAQLKQVKNEEQQQLVTEYGNLVWKQQMYVELIQDLTSIPYLKIFKPEAQMNVKQSYVTIFTKRKQTKLQKAQDFITSTLIMKGLNSIGQKAVMATSLASTVAGFNPMLMAMSFGLSKSYNAYKQHNNRSRLLQQLTEMKNQTIKNINKLQETYKSCLQMIKIIVNQKKQQPQDGQLMKKLRSLFFQIFEQEWLNINIQQDGDWEIVRISEEENFQVLQK